MMRVEVTDVTAELAVAWRPPRTETSRRTSRPARPLEAYAAAAGHPCGTLGVRGAADRPGRAAVRARHRPPHDPQRGRLDRPGRPSGQGLLPRPGDRRPRAHPRPPAPSADPAPPRRHREPPAPPWHRTCCTTDGCRLVGTSARHHELGPIALALVKRNVPLDVTLDADGIPAAQEILVDPEVGLHVRPNLRYAVWTRTPRSIEDVFRRAQRTSAALIVRRTRTSVLVVLVTLLGARQVPRPPSAPPRSRAAPAGDLLVLPRRTADGCVRPGPGSSSGSTSGPT